MQSPDVVPWVTEGPERLLMFADHELEKMRDSAEGLTRAALNEVLLLRKEIHGLRK